MQRLCYLCFIVLSASGLYAQNVGIGTTTPNYRFTVRGTGNEIYSVMSEDGTQAADNFTFQIAPGGGAANSRIGYLMGNFGNSTAGFMISNMRNAPIRFGFGGGPTEVMRITPSGNVGIGTTGPATRLDISQSAAFNTTIPGSGLYNVHLSAPQNGVNDQATGITFGTTNNLNAQAGIYVQNSINYGTKMYFGTTDNYTTGSQTRLTIDNTGKVGIGTTTPDYRLTVRGTGNEIYSVMSEDGTQAADNFTFQIAPGGGAANSRIGYLMGNFGNSTAGFMISNMRNAPIRFGFGGGPTEVMRIDPSGNIGIGSNAPGSKLVIAGTATGIGTGAEINYHFIRSGKHTATGGGTRILKLPAAIGTLRIIARTAAGTDYTTAEYRIINAGWNYPSNFSITNITSLSRGAGVAISVVGADGLNGAAFINIIATAGAIVTWSFEGLTEDAGTIEQ